MSGKKLVALVVGVCLLSAGIGSGVTLLAKQGPSGPEGAQGPRGPRGVEGSSGSEEQGERALNDVQDLEAKIDDLELEVSDLWEEQGFQEGQIAELGGQVTNNTQAISGMCVALELSGCP